MTTPDEAKRALMEAPTLVECPWCDGAGMVTFEKRDKWISVHPELVRSPPAEKKP